MKEHAVILIWRQLEIWAAAIKTISFINDINFGIFAGTAKELGSEVRCTMPLCNMSILLITCNQSVLSGLCLYECARTVCVCVPAAY